MIRGGLTLPLSKVPAGGGHDRGLSPTTPTVRRSQANHPPSTARRYSRRVRVVLGTCLMCSGRYTGEKSQTRRKKGGELHREENQDYTTHKRLGVRIIRRAGVEIRNNRKYFTKPVSFNVRTTTTTTTVSNHPQKQTKNASTRWPRTAA